MRNKLTLLVGLFFVIAIVTVGSILTTCGRTLTGAAQEKAQKESVSFLKTLGVNGKASCALSDSDGDGYISCPYVVDGDSTIHPLECASGLIMAEGCRPPKAVFIGNNGKQN